MALSPRASNHVTNSYFAGSDFSMRTVFEISRVEKLAAIVASEVALPFLSFCRKHDVIPSNCGVCDKCIRTKAMLMVTMGRIPEIFVDNAFNEQMLMNLRLDRLERIEILDLYGYAKDRGALEFIPGLLLLVEEYRRRDSN